jgi:CBS domain containing-hemolysin-like protein
MIAASFEPADIAILVAVCVLLVFAGLLALAETSLVRTSRARARSLAEQGRAGSHALEALVRDPEGFLAPVLLLVLVCQLVAATLVGVVAERLFGVFGVAAATVFEVIVIFVAAEAIPKHWAVRHPDRAALVTAPVIRAVIGFPPLRLISSFLSGLSRFVIPGGNDTDDQPTVTESELLALADAAVEADVIEAEERALLTSIIEFGDTIVREVMAPRPDVVAVEEQASVGTVLELATSAGLTRIPVYRITVDDIIGVAHVRDLIRALRAGEEARTVGELCRPVHYVPETKRVAPLLREMQHEVFHLAVVVDEYGGTAGIVTLEDVIEELVGEIADEFEEGEPDVELTGENELRVSGKMPIDEVNELAGTDLPEGDWDTIAGLLIHLAGLPLHEGDAVEVGGTRLVAARVQGRRVRAVKVIHEATPAMSTNEPS